MAEPSLSEWSFEALLQRVREGEKAARDELWSRCLRQVSQWAEKQRAQVEKVGARPSDVTQDSLLKAFQQLDHFQGTTEREWWAWLRQIVRNEAIGTYRHGTRKRRDATATVSLDGEELLGVKAQERSPSQVTALQEEWRRLISGFQWLEGHQPDQHQALKMFHLDEHPVKAIAEHMGRTPKAVESLMGRGVRALRAWMADEPVLEDPLSTEAAAERNEVDAAFSKYLRRLETGETVEVEAFVKGYPDCEEELRGMLHWMDQLRALDPSRKR
ncbi:sigma-70 family RNA polymerase sigma factor [Myxococcus sp. XM-1-1-1]|uniref:sigma-70 family RNA polymerase sigma factor n=1 Tax=Myxococcus sp. XM-1-1-1 TaxID=2874602 RepID=UPI001CBFFF06|nr:sigma-70 family RNA polymerase sigma factor [Myxococcus sp. XM-1-1-1]MBZ4413184.1 sigma-70 family RNA polymerase sigma factor [Myxococcus sp. XM-1-1-1]